MNTITSGAEHGTVGRYNRGCRCLSCSESKRRDMHAYRKRKYLGQATATDLVPADRVREHLQWLSQQGVGFRRVAELSGLSSASPVWHIARGSHKHVRRATENAILHIRPDCADDHARVDATLTWRRIHGLVALGYQVKWIAEQMGYPDGRLSIGRTQVRVSSARKVAELVAKYGNAWGPSEKARRLAQRRGWDVIGAWDDDLTELA